MESHWNKIGSQVDFGYCEPLDISKFYRRPTDFEIYRYLTAFVSLLFQDYDLNLYLGNGFIDRVQDAEACFILAARNYVDRGASVSIQYTLSYYKNFLLSRHQNLCEKFNMQILYMYMYIIGFTFPFCNTIYIHVQKTS